MITALMLLHLLSVQNRDPRYFVEVINPLTSTLAAHNGSLVSASKDKAQAPAEVVEREGVSVTLAVGGEFHLE